MMIYHSPTVTGFSFVIRLRLQRLSARFKKSPLDPPVLHYKNAFNSPSKSARILFFSILALYLLNFEGGLLYAGDEISAAQQKYINRELKTLKEALVLNPDVVQMVMKANENDQHYNENEIAAIDREWVRTEGVDLFVLSLITNTLADKLKEVQKKHRALVEIFVTDQRGLLIAATNKTSDFYQADEAWWQEAMRRADPDGFIGEVEYDSSSLSDALPLYLVIRDPGQSVIGIIKALCAIDKMYREEL